MKFVLNRYTGYQKPPTALTLLPQIPGNPLTKRSVLTQTEDGYQLVLTKTEGGSETVTTEDFTNDEMSRFISEGESEGF